MPQVLGSAATEQLVNQLYYVQWNNYLAMEPALQYGVYDSEYSYFMRLPDTWKDTVDVSISNATDDAWNVISKETQQLLVSVRVVESPSALTDAYVQGARVGDQYVMLYFGDDCSAQDARTIQRGVCVIE